MPTKDPESLAEAERFINALVAQEDIDKLDEAISALSVEVSATSSAG